MKQTEQDNKTIVIGAANVPHAEILEKAKPLLKKQGFDLKIKVFQDIVMPNKALLRIRKLMQIIFNMYHTLRGERIKKKDIT